MTGPKDVGGVWGDTYKQACHDRFNKFVNKQCSDFATDSIESRNSLCSYNPGKRTEQKKGESVIVQPLENLDVSIMCQILGIGAKAKQDMFSPPSSIGVNSMYAYCVAPASSNKYVQETIESVENRILSTKCYAKQNKKKCLENNFRQGLMDAMGKQYQGNITSVFYTLKVENKNKIPVLTYTLCCFDVNSHNFNKKMKVITPDEDEIGLSEFVKRLRSEVTMEDELMVIGYADSDRSDIHNLGLGWRRAKHVVDFLCSQGLDACGGNKYNPQPETKVLITSCGEQNPGNLRRVQIFYPAHQQEISASSCLP